MIFDVVTYCHGRRTVDLTTGSRRRAMDRFAELDRPDVRGDVIPSVLNHRGDVIAVGT